MRQKKKKTPLQLKESGAEDLNLEMRPKFPKKGSSSKSCIRVKNLPVEESVVRATKRDYRRCIDTSRANFLRFCKYKRTPNLSIPIEPTNTPNLIINRVQSRNFSTSSKLTALNPLKVAAFSTMERIEVQETKCFQNRPTCSWLITRCKWAAKSC